VSLERNKAVIQRLNAEVWNREDEAARVAAVDELFAPDLVAHRSGRVAFRGLEPMRELAGVVPHLYGDHRAIIDDLIAEGDRVVTRGRLIGTHAGELLGIPPTAAGAEGQPRWRLYYVH
jgi:predicted ester cyclase